MFYIKINNANVIVSQLSNCQCQSLAFPSFPSAGRQAAIISCDLRAVVVRAEVDHYLSRFLLNSKLKASIVGEVLDLSNVQGRATVDLYRGNKVFLQFV